MLDSLKYNVAGHKLYEKVGFVKEMEAGDHVIFRYHIQA